MIKAVIADDEPAVASIICHFIQQEALPISIVGVAQDGRAALELIRTLHPNIVFLDIQMPIHNGLEVMQLERTTRYIIITAYESFQYAQEALRLGAYDLLLKPVEGNQLVQAIARAIGWQFTKNTLSNHVLAYIHENFTKPVDLAGLADLFHATPSHLTRTFKKHTGLGIIAYLNKLRVDKAKTLLSNSELTIQDVATKTGYESLNNFYKHFKRITGFTPAGYRNELL